MHEHNVSYNNRNTIRKHHHKSDIDNLVIKPKNLNRKAYRRQTQNN